jgi:hypothetical protein
MEPRRRANARCANAVGPVDLSTIVARVGAVELPAKKCEASQIGSARGRTEPTRMSASYLRAASRRDLDTLLPPLPIKYASLAVDMTPLVRSVLVGNRDPAFVDVDDLLRALELDGSRHDWTSRLGTHGVCSLPAVLDVKQCAVLRDAVNAAAMEITDSVDGLLEHQLNLSSFAELGALIGHETTFFS